MKLSPGELFVLLCITSQIKPTEEEPAEAEREPERKRRHAAEDRGKSERSEQQYDGR